MSAVPNTLASWQDDQLLRGKTRPLAILYILAGGGACFFNLLGAGSQAHDVKMFLVYLFCTNLAVLSLRLVAGSSLIPAGFLILLLGVEELSLPELVFIAFTVALLGELQRDPRTPKLHLLLFAVANVSIGISAAQVAYRLASHVPYSALFPFPIIAASFVLLFNYGVARTLLTGGATPLVGLYRTECRPLLPWFIAAAYLAYLIRCTSQQTGVHVAWLALPVLFTLDRGYRLWSGAREDHAAELALLHRRTLETLSVVINARDENASQHLRRVQYYARAVGRELGLSPRQLDDLHVATMVYNIGQLGIPDHILLKPGTLTQEEWEKIKTHPATGSEMLSRMNFPPGVQSIVQTHHEKWNGQGYPEGLRGEQIPIGARILAAVDCVDALASDRPFRAALSIGEAMVKVVSEKGKSFDPQVIDILERRYEELERQAWDDVRHVPAQLPSSAPHDLGRLAARLLVEAGPKTNASIVDPIVAARQETQLLQALSAELAQSLRFEDIAAAAQKCLSRIVHFDTLVLYARHGDQLKPVAAVGRSARGFAKVPVPLAAGLSSRAFRESTPILNGDPRQELSYTPDTAGRYLLQSALAMPLESRERAIGVLTIYQTARDAFNRDHVRFMKAVSSHVAAALEGALKYEDVENLAGTDHLTGIANARALSLHLDRELSRAARDSSAIGVMVCDLNGFKGVNDRFGHMKGNQVLQHVARGMQEICRSSDYFARMGGDEFVVVVPGLREDLCDSYLTRLNSVAVEAGRSVCGEQCLSISVGIAIYPADGHDSESLLSKADQRMYQAKELHRSGHGPDRSAFPAA